MIQYPSGKKQYHKPKNPGFASQRGMSLEEDINQTNQYYRDENRAIIYKKPTPIQIVSVDYPSRNKAKITEAYFRQPSTTDYSGVFRGRAIDFEAKETKNKTLFPLGAISKHQLEHLKRVTEHGAIAFVLLRFKSYDETYLIFAQDLNRYLDEFAPKSLSLAWVREHGLSIISTMRAPCNYIEVIEQYLKETL